VALCGHVARPVAGSGSRIEDYGALMQGVGEPCMDVWEADAPDDVQGLRSKGWRWTRTARVADGSGHLRVRSSFPPECRKRRGSDVQHPFDPRMPQQAMLAGVAGLRS